MKKEYVYLDYLDVCIILIRINELNLNSVIINNFVEYVKRKSVDIYLTPSIILKLNKNSGKYKISKKLYEYLIKKTKLNKDNIDDLDFYLKQIFEIEYNLLSDKEELRNNAIKALKTYIK